MYTIQSIDYTTTSTHTLERVVLIWLHARKRVVDVTVDSLICSHSQQHIAHGRIIRQVPVALGNV